MTAKRLTEADVLALLEKRHAGRSGNGEEWAFVTHVRDAAGFDSSRTADALAMSLWPSRGLELHGFEVKVSRSDWQRELANPEKAERFCRIVDRWWLVVANNTIVRSGELPSTWGLMVVHGGRVVTAVAAPLLTPPAGRPRPLPEGFSRSFLASLLRSTARRADVTPEEIMVAVDAEREALRATHDAMRQVDRDEIDRLRTLIGTFEREAGVQMHRFYGGKEPADVGRAVRIVLDGEDERDRLVTRLRRLAESADEIAVAARRAVGDES